MNTSDKDIKLATDKVIYLTLLQEEKYSVSRTTIRPGGVTQWHHHTHVNDRFLVAKGVLTVEIRNNDAIETIDVHDYYNVSPGVVHHVRNNTHEDVVYVMLQSGGERDIVIIEAE